MTTQGRISDYQVDLWMDQLQGTLLFGTVFTSNPSSATDPLSVEVVGAGFSRTLASFSRTGTGTLGLDKVLAIPTIPPGSTIVAIGFMDAATNGHLVASDFVRDPVSGVISPRAYPTGGTFVVPANQFTIGIDIPSS